MDGLSLGAVRRAPLRLAVAMLGVVVVGLALARPADATYLTPSDAFYWNLPASSGNPYDQGGAIAASPDGNYVYVADKYANAVEEYTSDGAVKRILRFRRGTAPNGVATDLSGNVYVVYEGEGVVVKYTANLKQLSSWSVPFARSIAADRAGHLWVLTNFLNVVGEYDTSGKSIGGFAATNFPGRYVFFAGYDDPNKWVAKAIAVDGAGRPIVVGESYQSLSNPEPDCQNVIDSPYPYGVDHHPYPDPLVSGEAVRFTPGGTPIAYGWLSQSSLDCYHGWQSDGLNPGGVAVDPNGGDVYATSDSQLGVIHLSPGLGNSGSNLGFPSAACYSLDCAFHEWDLIAGNPPLSVAFDCHSNLYVLTNSNARAVVKLVNQSYVPPSACSPFVQRALAQPGITLFPKFGVNGPGKASVLIGCHVKLCAGTVSLGTNSSICPHCMISVPLHFRIQPGMERTLSLTLNKLGRKLLKQHPGLTIEILGKVKHGRAAIEAERLRAPATLTDACRIPAAPGGDASLTGTLTPSPPHARITLEYAPPETGGVFLQNVQRTVLTDGSGRFSDHYALGQAGRWVVSASWGGDASHQPTAARPCAGTVPKAQTHLTLTCPTAASIGTPSPFTGTLSGAPADALLAVLYQQPSGAVTAHDVTSGSAGQFSDSFAPNQSGAWQALAHYNGDANHTAAQATCQFTVAQPPSTLSLNCTPDPNAHYISCTGTLTSGGAGLLGAQVTLTYQPPSGTSTVHTATTVSDGMFSDSLTVPASGPPLTPGMWTVQAQYAGDSTHGPASNTQSVPVP